MSCDMVTLGDEEGLYWQGTQLKTYSVRDKFMMRSLNLCGEKRKRVGSEVYETKSIFFISVFPLARQLKKLWIVSSI